MTTTTTEQIQSALDTIDIWDMNCGSASQYHIEHGDFDGYENCKKTHEFYETLRAILTQALDIAKEDKVVVPREPTEEILDDILDTGLVHDSVEARLLYRVSILGTYEGMLKQDKEALK